jgi:hypothetical protein
VRPLSCSVVFGINREALESGDLWRGEDVMAPVIRKPVTRVKLP